MIDLHVHVLPALDDGPRTRDDALAQLDRAAELGVTTIVATPHLADPLTSEYGNRVVEAMAALRPLAEDRGLTLLQGFEIKLSLDLPQRLADGESIALAGTTAVLVELPFVGWPTFTEMTLFAVQSAGFTPVLAHPERYRSVQERPALALDLARRGVLLQVTCSSLVSPSRTVRRTAEHLLRSGLITVVASDSHGDDHRLRAVPTALDRLGDLIGVDEVDRLTVHNPGLILAGQTDRIEPGPDRRPQLHRVGWWRRLVRG